MRAARILPHVRLEIGASLFGHLDSRDRIDAFDHADVVGHELVKNNIDRLGRRHDVTIAYTAR